MTIDERLVVGGLPALPRRVWLEIDEDALHGNVHVFREIVGPKVALNAVVKADAYGHGMMQTARAFVSAGADRLCVASLDEALALRAAGIDAPLMVLFVSPSDGAAEAAARGIELTVSEVPTDHFPGTLIVHVEVETGLSRGGLWPSDVPKLLGRLVARQGITVAGLWSHMAMPEHEAYTAEQIARFDAAVEMVRAAGLPVPSRHLAATGGVLTGRVPAYEGVRIGLGLYGLLPLDLSVPEELRGFADRLRPAMQLKCHALRIEEFPAGVSVSYGGAWTAQRESTIATLPVGYGDAIPRNVPWGEVLVRGHRVPMVGNVAMDAVMVDVTDVPGVTVDDEFVLLGSQGGATISAAALARARNTIPWEVATGMSYRIPRVYHAGSVLMGVRTINDESRVPTGTSTEGDRSG